MSADGRQGRAGLDHDGSDRRLPDGRDRSVDFVGYGTTANCFEGTGPTPALSNTTSALRNGDGATDTNNNAADFTAGAPDPHPTADQAPTVASTTPANGATGRRARAPTSRSPSVSR